MKMENEKWRMENGPMKGSGSLPADVSEFGPAHSPTAGRPTEEDPRADLLEWKMENDLSVNPVGAVVSLQLCL